MQQDLYLVNKSTVPVGTCQSIRSLIEQQLRKRGVPYRIEVIANPEFLREGSAVSDFLKPDRLVIGAQSQDSISLMLELFRPVNYSDL